MQSGFYSLFMILAVWVVCLCLDNSRTQRLERDREVNQSIARGIVWVCGVKCYDGLCYLD